ncbi:LytR C-terminal domain-containing protein [Streptomyces sp. NBC_01216]|uniref:LytR C-terminal domain-containing protein n=1 Tax=Streptomyces sp. NBC_01216 TaxID=2903778 RepID=UPI002E159FF0|nr:LytR C-terminal domain-containing protein [Streptomyces sp. NBC_01216]
MNEQHNPYDPYYPQPQIVGYDEYGRPVYQQVPQQSQPPAPSQPPQQYDPYAQQQGYGYDAYGQPVRPPQQYDPYAQQVPQGYGHTGYDTGQVYGDAPGQGGPGQGAYTDGQGGYGGGPAGYDPGRPPAQDTGGVHDSGGQWAVRAEAPPAPAQTPRQAAPAPAGVPGQRPAPDEDGGRAYRTEQFSFIEEPDEDSEDVIDWLKFTESRSERREEARRRGRNRFVALVVVLVLAVVGGAGYLWSAGKLPGLSGEERKQNTATGPQKRDTIVVHLHDLKSGGTSTALLVDNTTTGQGTTVLLPNTLAVADDEGATTTLAKSVEDDGSSGTREAIGNLLGARITGTWRLDTPYLENLVELVSNIDITTDTEVPGAEKGEAPLVAKGENQTLNGRAAVAYATYRGPGEADAKQLQRFGQVLYGVLRKMSDDPEAATVTVQTLTQILDPSLPEKDLGASLAKLAEHAKGGDYKTALLPVSEDGSLADGAGDSVVKDILGGKVSAPEQGAVPRVSLRDATGKEEAADAARIVLINGGFAFVGTAKGDTAATSKVVYGDDTQKATATEVAKTLGLPDGSVEKGKAAGNADVTVVLGQDYKLPKPPS